MSTTFLQFSVISMMIHFLTYLVILTAKTLQIFAMTDITVLLLLVVVLLKLNS